MVGEKGTILRIFDSRGGLLCWLDLDHPLPLKWDLQLSYFNFWRDHLNEALKVIMQLNFRIKHKRSRLRKMIGLRDALSAVRKKFKENMKILERKQNQAENEQHRIRMSGEGRQRWAFVKQVTRNGKFKINKGCKPLRTGIEDHEASKEKQEPGKGTEFENILHGIHLLQPTLAFFI